MMLPYKPESAALRPAIIAGTPNGQLPGNVLDPCGIGRFVMVRPAARAMSALKHRADREGIRLWATGTYRSFDAQVALFLRRYDNTPRQTRHEFWRGKNWYLKSGVAGAAVPGSSNHGVGLAADLARKNMYGRVVSLDTKTLTWLANVAPLFGFWNTTTTENWHWCYCLGDSPMPAAVLAEEQHWPDPPAPTPTPELRLGDQNDSVKIVQEKLNRFGATLLVDGQFGPRTETAVKAFQTSRGITPDGVVGPETWAALYSQDH